MKNDIRIIDRGRGPQLSTSRVTVQDLVPYFQEGCAHEEIMRWIPTLTREEIAVVQAYYRENKAHLDEEDRQIRVLNAQVRNTPQVERIRERGREKLQALKEELARAKANGEAR
jgi:uncharacterized protein (DUF433 family)